MKARCVTKNEILCLHLWTNYTKKKRIEKREEEEEEGEEEEGKRRKKEKGLFL